MIPQAPPITNEAYHALQASRIAKGEPMDHEMGEWVLDHYRKRVKPLIDDEAFAEILLALDRLTAFNLDNFRDPYLMREGKLLRARLTPKVLKLAERVGEYNDRGEIVPKGMGEAERRAKEEEEERKRLEEAEVKDEKDEKEEGKLSESEGDDVMAAATKSAATKPTTPADPPTLSLGTTDPTTPTANADLTEALTPEEISSLIISYQDLSDHLDELLMEDEEDEEDVERDEADEKADALLAEERRLAKLVEGGGPVAGGDKKEVEKKVEEGEKGEAKAEGKGLNLTGADGAKLA